MYIHTNTEIAYIHTYIHGKIYVHVSKEPPKVEILGFSSYLVVFT